ncbi:tmem209 [Scenedesmus sp. PABB004]|nr:tmem209 [Scenedesmus sp. PABB004]
MAAWNARPAYSTAPLGPSLDRGAALHSLTTYGLVAAAAAGASKFGLPLLLWLQVPHAASIGVALSLTAALCVLGGLNTFSRWRDSSARAKTQAGLAPRQRELMGLPPTPPAKPKPPPPDAAPAAARAATLLATPIAPAQRLPPLAPSAASVGGDAAPRLAGGGGATPGSAGRSSLGPSPGSRRSPWSTAPAVATPEQLRHYVDAFAASSTPPGADAHGDGFGAASPLSPLPAGALAYGDQGDQGLAGGSPALPTGRDAPSYRPSLLARKAAAAGAGAGGGGEGLQPSADADAGRIMRDMLQMQVPELLVWIERFREWASSQLLSPLSALMDSAHEEPNALMARLVQGGAPPQLPCIADLLDLPSADGDGAAHAGGGGGGGGGGWAAGLGGAAAGLAGAVASAGAGALAAVGGGGGGGAGAVGAGGGSASAVEDARCTALHLLDTLRRSQLPYGYDPQPLLAALHRYSELLLLLSGRRPGELLPPAPASYIGARIRALAGGTCMRAFAWNGGGEHEGRPWSPELPSDSGLVFYLFAAYLDAPGWQFPLAGAGPDGSRGAPLYLGTLRSRPPASYSALLALLLAGQLVTLCERDGVFKALLMWLQCHAVGRHGLVGGRSQGAPLPRAMGAGGSKLHPAEEQRLGKKCRTLSTAWSKCHKANPDDARACANLETALVQVGARARRRGRPAAGAGAGAVRRRGEARRTHAHARAQCYAAELCKPQSEAHQRCYMSLMNTGYYQMRRDCEETVDAMKACLKRVKLYPFER